MALRMWARQAWRVAVMAGKIVAIALLLLFVVLFGILFFWMRSGPMP